MSSRAIDHTRVPGAALGYQRRRGISRAKLFRAVFPYLLILPVVLYEGILVVYPIIGIIQVPIRLIPGINEGVQFFGDATLARGALIAISCWKAYPFYALVFLAALGNIPEQLYEAARVDGANVYHQFRYLTLPFIRPMFLICTILALIFAIKGFSLSFLFTGG